MFNFANVKISKNGTKTQQETKLSLA